MNEVKNDTFIARRRNRPSCCDPACPTVSCHTNGALQGDNKSTRRQREKHMHTTQREEEEGDNDRFNAVSHKHALIRAEG